MQVRWSWIDLRLFGALRKWKKTTGKEELQSANVRNDDFDCEMAVRRIHRELVYCITDEIYNHFQPNECTEKKQDDQPWMDGQTGKNKTKCLAWLVK